jgi:hypothetical protein
MISKVYLKVTICDSFAVQMCARERERKIEVVRNIVCNLNLKFSNCK